MGDTEHPPRPGENQDPRDEVAQREHVAKTGNEKYKRHEHEEYEEVVEDAERAEHEFDEAVEEAKHEVDGR